MAATPERFIDDYLSYLLARASHAVYKEFEKQVNAAGLASLEWRVLATLSGGDGLSEGLTIGELAREVLAKQPTLTKLVQRMAQSGWVRLGVDAADARRTVVFATARGRRVVARLIDAARAHEAELLAGLGSREVTQLKALLRRLAHRDNA
jgi:DNA-binding MarR family transcriptional regulator